MARHKRTTHSGKKSFSLSTVAGHSVSVNAHRLLIQVKHHTDVIAVNRHLPSPVH